MLKYQKNEKGFTLIELLIVVAIIGILAAIAIPQFAAYRMRAFNSAGVSDINNFQKSEAAFFSDWQVFGQSAAAAAAAAPNAATAADAGALVVGPDNGAGQVIWVTGNAQSMQIGLSNNVRLIAHTDATGTSFFAVTKHDQGDRMYGVDSDITATYFSQGVQGTALTAAEGVAGTLPAVNDLDAAGITTGVNTLGNAWTVM